MHPFWESDWGQRASVVFHSSDFSAMIGACHQRDHHVCTGRLCPSNHSASSDSSILDSSILSGFALSRPGWQRRFVLWSAYHGSGSSTWTSESQALCSKGCFLGVDRQLRHYRRFCLSRSHSRKAKWYSAPASPSSGFKSSLCESNYEACSTWRGARTQTYCASVQPSENFELTETQSSSTTITLSSLVRPRASRTRLYSSGAASSWHFSTPNQRKMLLDCRQWPLQHFQPSSGAYFAWETWTWSGMAKSELRVASAEKIVGTIAMGSSSASLSRT